MQELAEYSKQIADFKAIKLEAHKFGTLISFSQEALDDTGYNLESELLRQLSESYSMTLDELIVKGNAEYDVQGAALVLVAEFYDNRTISVNDRLNLRVNMMLESLIGRYSVNLI